VAIEQNMWEKKRPSNAEPLTKLRGLAPQSNPLSLGQPARQVARNLPEEIKGLAEASVSLSKRLITPGSFSDKTVLFASIALLLLVCFIDIKATESVQLNLLYLFPMFLISVHCTNKRWVLWIYMVGIFLQILTMILYVDITLSNKILKMIFVIPANILVVHLGFVYQRTYLALRQTSITDALTGLDNRRSLEIITSREIDRQKRYPGIFSFALLDLDGFKLLNDTKGHKAGDEALKLLASILNKQIRHSDTSGRIGGDEFVILMPNTSADDAVTFCNKLCTRIAGQMQEAGFSITVSIGSVTFDHPPDSFESILSLADGAMYEAKAKGKGQVVSK
jgi:diguanylate cyclase (GGDEF)-like protein